MADYTNRFKQSLKAGQANIGLWISIPDAFTTELCATAEFDWMLLDGEHTPSDARMVLSQLQANDVLLIAGKGHETGQIIGDKVYPFDDRVEVLRHIGNDLRAV